MNIESLPPELILNIFKYLLHNELCQAARVCRTWNKLTKSLVLWKRVHVEFLPSHKSQTKVANNFITILPSCVTHVRIDFENHDAWPGQLNFEELSARLKERCPHLYILILYGAILRDSLVSVIDLCTLFLKNVRSLVLFYSIFLDCPSRGACIGTSKLEVLDLFGSYLGQFNKLPFLKMQCLKVLRLARTDVDNSWFENNSSLLNQLQILELGDTCINADAFEEIRTYALNLEELYLCGIDDLEDDNLNFSGTAFPQLRTICLRYCDDVTCDGIVSLIMSCPSLHNVYVDEDMVEICAMHPFIVDNKCKLEIIKAISCSTHKKLRQYL